MIDNTVLVVNADQETEEKIVSTLKREGYQVFTASELYISAEIADNLNPSLIYLQATSSTIQVCEKIHSVEKFKKVPIILLGSLSETLDAQASFDAVVGYLIMPVSPDELIEKTREILGSASDFKGSEEYLGFKKEETSPVKEPSRVKYEYSFDTKTDNTSENVQPGQKYSESDKKEEGLESLLKKSMRKRPSKSGLLTPVIVVTAAIVILAVVFFLYKSFISKPEIPASEAVKPTESVQHQEPAVLPPPEQQEQEQPAAEEKPAIENEAPKVAPEVIAPEAIVAEKPSPKEQKQEQPVPKEKLAVKNEVPKVTPGVAAPEAKGSEKPFYSVQLGAFKIEANAEELAKTHKEKGYETFIHRVTAKDNVIFHFVLIGKFENRKEALQSAEYIRAKEKIETTVFRVTAK